MSNDIKDKNLLLLVEKLRAAVNQPDDLAVQSLDGLMTGADVDVFLKRDEIRTQILQNLRTTGQLVFKDVADQCDCGEDLVMHVWRISMRDQYPPTPVMGDFCVSIPKETRAQNLVESILGKSGFRLDTKKKAIIDFQNGMQPISYRVSRGRDIPSFVKAGAAHCGFLGNDKLIEVQAEALLEGRDPVEMDIRQQFTVNAFRMCFAVPKDQTAIRSIADLEGKKILTSYTATAQQELARRGITPADIKYQAGDVEASCRVLGYDAIMDIVETGSSLRKAGMVTLGNPLYAGDMSLITVPEAQRPMSEGDKAIMERFMKRLTTAQKKLEAA